MILINTKKKNIEILRTIEKIETKNGIDYLKMKNMKNKKLLHLM